MPEGRKGDAPDERRSPSSTSPIRRYATPSPSGGRYGELAARARNGVPDGRAHRPGPGREVWREGRYRDLSVTLFDPDGNVVDPADRAAIRFARFHWTGWRLLEPYRRAVDHGLRHRIGRRDGEWSIAITTLSASGKVIAAKSDGELADRRHLPHPARRRSDANARRNRGRKSYSSFCNVITLPSDDCLGRYGVDPTDDSHGFRHPGRQPLHRTDDPARRDIAAARGDRRAAVAQPGRCRRADLGARRT